MIHTVQLIRVAVVWPQPRQIVKRIPGLSLICIKNADFGIENNPFKAFLQDCCRDLEMHAIDINKLPIHEN
jgi:hypothetical protein